MDSSHPKDETLRLLLSKDHAEWLRGEIEWLKRAVWGFAVIAVIGTGWLAGMIVYAGSFVDTAQVCVTLSEGQSLADLIAQGLVASDAVLCETPSSIGAAEQSRAIPIALAIISLFALVMVFTSIGNVFQYRRKVADHIGYLEDHKAFLKKYNRE